MRLIPKQRQMVTGQQGKTVNENGDVSVQSKERFHMIEYLKYLLRAIFGNA